MACEPAAKGILDILLELWNRNDWLRWKDKQEREFRLTGFWSSFFIPYFSVEWLSPSYSLGRVLSGDDLTHHGGYGILLLLLGVAEGECTIVDAMFLRPA